MKKYLSFFSIVLFAYCDSPQRSTPIITHSPKTDSNTVVPGKIDPESEQTRHTDTIDLDKQQLLLIKTDSGSLYLLSSSGDPILKNKNYYTRIEYPDINGDGFKDIRAYVNSNTPNQCENYLYDNSGGRFRLIENCDLDIEKISNTDLYYSYNKAGCADLNWESHLGRLSNFNLIPAGLILGQGCGSDPIEQKIDIYKVSGAGDNKILAETLPYKKNIPKNDAKWAFIEKYWKSNFKKFL